LKLIGPTIHPGEILADELTELDVTASDLARAIGVPINRVTQIVNGKRGITADTALRLGQWFGSGPEIWLDLQKDYELRLAEMELGDTLEAIQRRPNGPGDTQPGLF
jgi:addiction module HigA family antidote